MAINYNLDLRCQNIVKQLVYSEGYKTVQQIADELKISRRSVYYDIQRINDWLESQEIEPLTVVRRKGILILEQDKIRIRNIIQNEPETNDYVFSPQERIKIITCYILRRSKPLHIDDFIDLCQVSRNTIINDIKEAGKALEEFQLKIVYEIREGYRIVGDVMTKRCVFFIYFPDIMEFCKNGFLPLDEKDQLDDLLEKLRTIEKDVNAQYVKGTLYSIAVFFSTIENHSNRVDFNKKEKMEIMKTKEFERVNQLFPNFAESEQVYLALYLLSSRNQIMAVDFMNAEDEREIIRLAKLLVLAFSRLASVRFEREEELIKALTLHLKTSMYRYKYGIQLGNPLLDNIKKEYSELFKLTSRACKYLEQEIKVPIPEGEVAYITLHFGAFITSDWQEKDKELNILIVCPNGLSTANMIRSEVMKLVPNAKKVDAISLTDYQKKHEYTVVISTLIIEEEPSLVVVHPILNDNDRISILRKCMKYDHQENSDVLMITKIAQKYMSERALLEFKDELSDYYMKQTLGHYSKRSEYGKGLIYNLEIRHINIINQKLDWRDAIRRSSKSLLEEGYIRKSYIDAMIQKTEQYGSYMFINNDVVLAHSQIEDGSNFLGISMNIMKIPAVFYSVDGNERKAKIIMVLAAENQMSHIKILNDIMTIFKDKENANMIWNTQSPENVMKIMKGILEEEL